MPALVRRRTLLLLGVGATVLPTTAAWTNRTDRQALPIRVAVGNRASFQFRHLPLDIAQQLGFFAPEGANVVVQHHASDTAALRAMEAGLADVCAVDFEQLLRKPEAIDAGARCFVLQTRTPQAALGVSLHQLPDLKSLTDLKPGSTVGVCALGSLSHTMASLALEQAGVATNAISFVAVGDEAGARTALLAGHVQALCHGDPLMAQLQQQNKLRIVTDARTLAGTRALFGGPVLGGCLVASAAMLHERAMDVQAVAHGVVRALKWLQTAAADDIVKVMPNTRPGKERSMTLAAFARMRETFSPDGNMPFAGTGTALRSLKATHAVAASELELPKVAVLHTFARKAKLKFSA